MRNHRYQPRKFSNNTNKKTNLCLKYNLRVFSYRPLLCTLLLRSALLRDSFVENILGCR